MSRKALLIPMLWRPTPRRARLPEDAADDTLRRQLRQVLGRLVDDADTRLAG